MSQAPPEPRDGQDDPPNLILLLKALRAHLSDLDSLTLDSEEEQRNGALLRALVRYLKAQGETTVDGRDPVPDGAVD